MQRELGYGLADAKKITDRILEGELVLLEVEDQLGEHLAAAFNALGANCQLVPVPQHA